MFNFESQSQNFFAHLEPQGHKTFTEKKPARLLAVTAQDLGSMLPGMSEAKMEAALAALANDQSDIVTRLSFDQHL